MRRTAPLLAVVWLALVGAASPQVLPLTATTVTGQAIRLNQDQHAVVVIHFWATWCLPCRVEMPILDAISRKYGKRNVQVIGIALDTGANRQKIAAAGASVSFPLARLGDTNVRPHNVPAALPQTLVYGRDGRLRYRFGAGGTRMEPATLDRVIPPLIAEH